VKLTAFSFMACVVSDDGVVRFCNELFLETIFGKRARFTTDGSCVEVILKSLNSEIVVMFICVTEIFEEFVDVSDTNLVVAV